MNHFSVVAMGRLAQDHPGVFRRGEFQGAMGSVQGMAGLIGPVIFSGSFAYVTSPGALWRLTGAPFFISAALSLGALILTVKGARAEAAARSPSDT